MPAVHTIRGKATVASVVDRIGKAALGRLQPHLERAGLTALPDQLLLVGLKEERRLEVYYRSGDAYQRLTAYPFTAFSGTLGPKLREGDRQIPEGIYEIVHLNPNSAYYLSMKVSYPNALDRAKTRLGSYEELGGDIFIHGKATTVGCIPVGDRAIEELFLLVHNALDQGVRVILSPRDFRKNPAEPAIEGIDWEGELYRSIKEQLASLPL